MQQKFQPERSALRVTFGSNAASLLIVLLFGLLIINCIFIDRGYFDALPQDLFGFLDSVYRTHLGQIPHRDFSTPQGPLYYLLPSYFISLGSNPIASIRYYHVLNLLAALGIVLYAQRTRLDGVTAVFLGALVALALACKQLLGESPFFSTEGMFYNRIGFAFLTLELVLLLPPSAKSDLLSVVDGIIVGLICAMLFYIKITFGIAAIGLALMSSISDGRTGRGKAQLLLASAVVFILVAVAVEFVYGVRFAWLRDIQMAILSSSGSQPWKKFSTKLASNLPEVVFCIVIPLIVMRLAGLRMRSYWFIYGAVLAFFSVALLVYSAQLGVLFLPLVFPIFALSKFDQSGELRTTSRPYALAIKLILLFVIAAIAYPMALNVAYSSARYWTASRLPGAADAVGSLRTRETSEGLAADVVAMTSANALELVEGSPPLDAFMAGRESKGRVFWDNLSFSEFGFYLSEGLRAAKAGCPQGARIAIVDYVNPFPLLLGWPEGGGMAWVAVDYLVSKAHHLDEKEMYRGIDCVMIPKMPLDPSAKQFLLETYGAFLEQNYKKTFDSSLWTVMSAGRTPSNSGN